MLSVSRTDVRWRRWAVIDSVISLEYHTSRKVMFLAELLCLNSRFSDLFRTEFCFLQIWHIFSRVEIVHHLLHVSIFSPWLVLCLSARFLRVHRQQPIRWTHRWSAWTTVLIPRIWTTTSSVSRCSSHFSSFSFDDLDLDERALPARSPLLGLLLRSAILQSRRNSDRHRPNQVHFNSRRYAPQSFHAMRGWMDREELVHQSWSTISTDPAVFCHIISNRHP